MPQTWEFNLMPKVNAGLRGAGFKGLLSGALLLAAVESIAAPDTFLRATCQLPSEITNHVFSRQAPKSFCVHKVTDPTRDLITGELIPVTFRLQENLEVAFANFEKSFERADLACEGLGDGWKAPLSSVHEALPRALNDEASIEGLKEYFNDAVSGWFWSGSEHKGFSDYAKYVDLSGKVGSTYKTSSLNVFCVRRN